MFHAHVKFCTDSMFSLHCLQSYKVYNLKKVEVESFTFFFIEELNFNTYNYCSFYQCPTQY